MPHTHDPFAPAVHTAHEWLRAVADSLDTTDLVFAHRALRAWLHAVRDRIGVANSAHFAAQLPELLRGLYYEGWVPSHVPVRHGVPQFIEHFARTADIRHGEVTAVAGAVTAALSELFSPGQMNRVFSALPAHLCAVLDGQGSGAYDVAHEPRERGSHKHIPPEESVPTADRVQALGDAVAALARGLEQLPTVAGDADRAAAAAQEAHRILLAGGLVSTTRGY